MGRPEHWYIRFSVVSSSQNSSQQHKNSDSLKIYPKMKTALRSLVLLSAACAVLTYRAPQAPGGSYSLPSIGKYPSPTVFNPKNQGLPDAYKHFRISRSVDDQVALERGQFAEQSEVPLPVDEVLRQVRSADEFKGEEQLFGDDLAELTRQRRSSGYRIIRPTYRPPPRGPPKIYRV